MPKKYCPLCEHESRRGVLADCLCYIVPLDAGGTEGWPNEIWLCRGCGQKAKDDWKEYATLLRGVVDLRRRKLLRYYRRIGRYSHRVSIQDPTLRAVKEFEEVVAKRKKKESKENLEDKLFRLMGF